MQELIFGNVLASVGPVVGTPTWTVTFLYHGLLSRAPDSGGLTLYTSELSAGDSVAQVAQQILGSPEGRLTTIARLYRDELGSTASIPALQADAGVAYWASLLGADSYRGGRDGGLAKRRSLPITEMERNRGHPGTGTNIIMAKIRDAQRMASHYAADLSDDLESWRRDHTGQGMLGSGRPIGPV